MKQERTLYRNIIRPIYYDYDNTTTISFIPVCDNCNYVFDRVVAERDSIDLEPCVCPKCNKYINNVRLPVVDTKGKLDYEENIL